MRALRIHGYGGPEVMRIDDVPVPSAAEGQLAVKVRSASIPLVEIAKVQAGMRSAPTTSSTPAARTS